LGGSFVKEESFDLAVIGGGPAGMAAALAASKHTSSICIIERDGSLGGVLNQCIHSGFGLHIFGQDFTGPEYAEHFIDKINESGIQVKLDTMVLEITPQKEVYTINGVEGIVKIRAKVVVLSMGCRERPRGAINIPGFRPAGIYTAGTAQRLINIEGIMPGKEVVILGSGDIGLIMARRLTLEGARVKAVIEILPYPGGLARNVVQCLEDFDIPLYLEHTITKIHGKHRVTGVTVSPVSEGKPDLSKSWDISCDTLLFSVGLIPENELSRGLQVDMDSRTGGPKVTQNRETSVSGVFACGNVLHVHDLVDNVTQESQIAGEASALYALGQQKSGARVEIKNGRNIRYTVPQYLDIYPEPDDVIVYARVQFPEDGVSIRIKQNGQVIYGKRERRVKPGESLAIKLSKSTMVTILPGSDLEAEVVGRE
jgi:NADPH-dependent 2,4-dienoyl-CoA reductase/sulfur reductase-like enzyme